MQEVWNRVGVARHSPTRRQRAGFAVVCLMSMLATIASSAAQAAPLSMQAVPSLAPMLAKVTPGVVGISVARSANQENPLLKDPFFKKFFEDAAKAKGRSTPAESEVRPSGSGVIIDATQGLVLTNHHVIRNASRVVVVMKDRRELSAQILGTDAGTDIALLKVDGRGLIAVPMGKSDRSQVGDYVLAIGNPFGMGQTVTSGIVSAVGRSGISPEGYEDYIQTDAAINPGNSGGALVNMRGELIGINTAILTGGQGNNGNIGIGFAVPIAMAQEVFAQIKRFGEVRRGQIGVQSVDVTPRLAQEMRLPVSKGALISTVEPNSSANLAHLRAGDVVLQLNGKPVRSAVELRNRLALIPVGDIAAMHLIRGAEFIKASMVVAAIPTLTVQAPSQPSSEPGTQGDNTQEALAQVWGLELGPSADGTLPVARVNTAGRAYALGLRDGDVIVAVNRKAVPSPEALAYFLTQSGERVVSVLRGKDKLRFGISP